MRSATPAWTPRTFAKAAAPSWKSASRNSRAGSGVSEFTASGRIRHHSHCLDLHLGTVLDQPRYLHRRHRRKTPAHDIAIHRPDLFQSRGIFGAVGQKPRHRYDMLWPRSAGLGHGYDVLQGLTDLRDQIV